jgi:hypothetical protein
MNQLLNSATRIALAGISLVALYDILAVGKKGNPGSSAYNLGSITLRGYSALLARGSGQKPPAGF